MAQLERVTVTLPAEVAREIDRRAKNRSLFVAEALVRELDRRRREELERSLRNPHGESAEMAEPGMEEWARGLPEEDGASLVDGEAGVAVRWVSGEGWKEGER